MSCEVPFRRQSGAFAAVLLMLLRLGAAAEEPRKSAAARRSFDFSRPEPGEMLANPVRGTGAAPSLAQFMAAAADPRRDDGPGAGPPAAAARPDGAAGGAAATSQPAPPAPAPAPPPIPVDAAQASLASRIVRLGIEGALTASPANVKTATREGDALLDQLRRSLAGIRSTTGEPQRIQTPRSGESLDVTTGR